MFHEASKTPETGAAWRLALSVSATYAVFGVAWILLSDAAVLAVSSEPAWLELAQRYKGLFYVLITAAGLAALVYAGYRRQMRADHEARSSELRVQDLFLQHPQAMWLVDPISLAFLKVNDAAVRRYGYSEAEFLRMTLADIRPPEDIPHLREKVAPPLAGRRDVGVVRHRKKSGEIIHAQITVHPVPYEGGTAVMSMAIDVTREVSIQHALEHQEAQFRQLHQSLGEMLWLAGVPGGEVLYVSPAVERIHGVNAEDFRLDPHRWLERVHPEDRALARASGERLPAQAQSSCEYRIVRPDGGFRWISDRRKVIVDEQGQARMIGGIAEDITAAKETEETLRRQADELARRNAELERFNQATVGREIDMIELKREVNRLSQQLGLPPPHTLAFLAGDRGRGLATMPALPSQTPCAMTFADNLKQLPSVAHLAGLQLLDASGEVVATLENKPGQAGSVAVYAALAQRHGAITPAAAAEGLQLYAEHTDDAHAHPGKHPNIDRLIGCAAGGLSYAVRLLPA